MSVIIHLFCRFLCGLGSLGFLSPSLPLRYVPDDECHYFLILLAWCRFFQSFSKYKCSIGDEIDTNLLHCRLLESLLELLRVFLQ